MTRYLVGGERVRNNQYAVNAIGWGSRFCRALLLWTRRSAAGSDDQLSQYEVIRRSAADDGLKGDAGNRLLSRNGALSRLVSVARDQVDRGAQLIG